MVLNEKLEHMLSLSEINYVSWICFLNMFVTVVVTELVFLWKIKVVNDSIIFPG